MLGLLLLLPLGCSERPDATAPDGGMATLDGQIDGSPDGLCQPAEFPACATTVEVRDPADLTDALASAAQGDCLIVAGGSYPSATIPPGVSLLGASGPADAPRTRFETLELSAGAAAACIRVGAAQVPENAGGARLDRVLISGSTVGVTVGLGASVILVESTIEGSAVAGVAGEEAAAVTLERSTIRGGEGPAVRLTCVNQCDRGGGAKLLVTDSTIDGTASAGLEAIGRVAITLTGSTISGVQARDGQGGQGVVLDRGPGMTGGGIAMTDSLLEDNEGAGLWAMDATNINLGGSDMMGNPLPATVKGNGFGVVVRSSVAGQFNAYLQNVEIEGNLGLGLAFDGPGYSYVQQSRICHTRKAEFPGTGAGDPVEVGDGMLWTGASYVQFYGVTFCGNERFSILVDGPVGPGSSGDSVTFEEGDQGVQIQDLPSGGAQPTWSSNVPMAGPVSSEELYPLPSLER